MVTALVLPGVGYISSEPGNSAVVANPFTSVGSSWTSVPASSRIYFEDFGYDYDDSAIYYVPAGVTCTSNGIIATGPFLWGVDADTGSSVTVLNASMCGGANPLNSTPIGFNLNFFGTTYTSLYPNTNGTIFYQAPDSGYDEPIINLVEGAGSSAMFPLGMDLYYDLDESNFWVAQTTVDGNQAFVLSWEGFDACCNQATPDNEDASLQLVLIDLGGGDFNAYFNYDKITNIAEGYDAPAYYLDLANGVTVGSNVVTLEYVDHFPVGCVEVDDTDDLGTATDSSFVSDSDGFIQLLDATAKTATLWSDNACTLPVVPAVLQDVTRDSNSYLEILIDGNFEAASVGWGTYDTLTGAIKATELLANIDRIKLWDNGSDPLRLKSLNTSVPGRFVIGQRGGETVTEGVSRPSRQPSTKPVVLKINPTNVTQKNEIITLTGARLTNFKHVRVGGVLVEVFYTSDNRLSFYAPQGLTGSQYVEIETSSGTIVLADPLVFTSQAVLDSKTKLVSKYEVGSSTVNQAIKDEVKAFLSANPALQTLSCTGYSASKSIKLANKRALAVCNYAKSLKPDLFVVVKTGIKGAASDAKARRVKLVVLQG